MREAGENNEATSKCTSQLINKREGKMRKVEESKKMIFCVFVRRNKKGREGNNGKRKVVEGEHTVEGSEPLFRSKVLLKSSFLENSRAFLNIFLD